MTRIIPFLAAASTAAFLGFGGAAFAMATNGNGGHPGGPSGPSGPGSSNLPQVLYGCDYQADKNGLTGAARRAFIGNCQQSGAS
jgi:hypothetical protein